MAFIHIDGLVQERRNSNALAIELRLSCTNPLTYSAIDVYDIFTSELLLYVVYIEVIRQLSFSLVSCLFMSLLSVLQYPYISL